MITALNQADREQLAADLGQLPDATKRADLELLAQAMRALTGEAQIFFASELIHHDLMRFTDEALLVGMTLAREQGVLAQAVSNMFAAFPELAADLIEDAVDHCLNGTDETDPQSAGGWNQDEVLAAYASLFVARDQLTIPFGSNVQ